MADLPPYYTLNDKGRGILTCPFVCIRALKGEFSAEPAGVGTQAGEMYFLLDAPLLAAGLLTEERLIGCPLKRAGGIDMEYRVQDLQRAQTADVYDQWIRKHFPPEEIKPLKNILKMWDDGAYRALGIYEGRDMDSGEGNIEWDLAGYAFFAAAPNCNLLLLDYFAIVEAYRGKGTGSVFLREMKERRKGYKGILIETEDAGCAKNEDELQIRRKRNSFYEQNGAVRTGIKSRVYGVNYDIWNLPLTEKAAEEECRENLRNIYRMIAPGDKYDKYVRI